MQLNNANESALSYDLNIDAGVTTVREIKIS
jgi:hypothetical protein